MRGDAARIEICWTMVERPNFRSILTTARNGFCSTTSIDSTPLARRFPVSLPAKVIPRMRRPPSPPGGAGDRGWTGYSRWPGR